MDTITIEIYPSTAEDGFHYRIFGKEIEDCTDDDEIDGGFCTTSIENALEMARCMAEEIIAKQKQKSPERALAQIVANDIQKSLVETCGPMDGDQVEEFSEMLQEEINKLMGNV